MRRTVALSVLVAICGACSGSSSPTAPSRQITVSGGASGNAFGTIAGSEPLVTAQAVKLADCLRPSPAPACFSSLPVRPTSQTAKTLSALAAPINLNASSSGSSVTLTWVASSGADAYIIEAGSAPGLANLANFSTGTSATSFQASGVGPGAYYVRVRALNGAGVSAPSNEVLLVVGSAPCVMPGAPSGLTTVSISGSTVVLSWTASAGSPTSYVVEAGSSSGLSNLANSDLGSAATSLTATGVGNGTYHVRVRAKNACGTSGPSNELIVTVGSTPTAPTGLTATAGNGQVTLSWTAVSGATSYNLYWDPVSPVLITDHMITGVTSPYIHTGRTNGTTYYYRVTAVSAAGESGLSTQASATPGGVATPVKRFFTTNATYSGNLKTVGGGTSGLNGADRICQQAATAAALGGTWIAWLSDDSTNAIDRITSDGPWFLVDKTTKVFNNKTNFQTAPIAKLKTNENGATVPPSANFSVYVWTGTLVGGTRAGATQNCSNWTTSNSFGDGYIGDANSTTGSWTALSTGDCVSAGTSGASPPHLYCIEP